MTADAEAPAPSRLLSPLRCAVSEEDALDSDTTDVGEEYAFLDESSECSSPIPLAAAAARAAQLKRQQQVSMAALDAERNWSLRHERAAASSSSARKDEAELEWFRDRQQAQKGWARQTRARVTQATAAFKQACDQLKDVIADIDMHNEAYYSA